MKALAAVLLGFVVTSVDAQKITGAEIIEYGVLKKIKPEGRLDVPNTVAGKSNNMIAAQLVENTSRVNASIGITFGILVKLPRRTGGSHDHGSFSLLGIGSLPPVGIQLSRNVDWVRSRSDLTSNKN